MSSPQSETWSGTKLWHLKLATVSVVSLSFIPLDPNFPASYWIGMEPAMRRLWEIREVGLVLVVTALIAIFRKDLRLLIVVGATGAAAALFCHLIYLSGIRQTGIFFVAVLTALWMQRVHRPRASWLVPVLLLCGSVAGIETQIGQWLRPFSNAQAAARFLNDRGLRYAGLIGVRDDWTIPVAQLLGRPIYGLDCQCTESFLRFDSSHDNNHGGQFAERLARAVSEVQGPPILIYDDPWGRRGDYGLESVGLRAVPIAEFHGAESGENYQIYRIESAW